jgi:hypothetical protein
VSTPNIRACVGSGCGLPVRFWIKGLRPLTFQFLGFPGEGHPFVSTPNIRACVGSGCGLPVHFWIKGLRPLIFLISVVSG